MMQASITIFITSKGSGDMENRGGQWSVVGGQEAALLRPSRVGLFFIVSIATALLFFFYPQIDLFISKLFYISGPKFYLSKNIVLAFLRHAVEALAGIFIVLWPCLFIAIFIKKRPVWGLTRLRVLYLFVALAVGPGLVVNTIFKDMWGRARPSQIVMFGGTKIFTPAFVVSDQCKVNCSFVSGDPSIGFYFFALALAIPRRRKLFTITAFSLGTLFGITRIIQGGHFLSDVIFSGIFTFAASYLLYLVLLKIERNLQKP